jgi:D-alanine-D-alanine ligase
VLLNRLSARQYVFDGPVIVKPNSAGSSIGVSLVTDPALLAPAIAQALEFDGDALVEELIDGREIDIAVMRRPDGSVMVSPALEVERDGLFDHNTKYGGAAIFSVPAMLDADARTSLESAAVRMYDALGCAGVARIDFFLTSVGLVLNEVNTTPGFTAQSQVPRMFEAAGMPYERLLDTLVADAIASRGRSVAATTGQ